MGERWGERKEANDALRCCCCSRPWLAHSISSICFQGRNVNRSCRSSSRSLFASPVPPTCPLHLSWPSRKDEYQKRDEWFTSIPGPACGIASLYIYFPRCCRTHRLLLDDDWIYNRARERVWLLLATTRLLMHSNDRFANKSSLSLSIYPFVSIIFSDLLSGNSSSSSGRVCGYGGWPIDYQYGDGLCRPRRCCRPVPTWQ